MLASSKLKLEEIAKKIIENFWLMMPLLLFETIIEDVGSYVNMVVQKRFGKSCTNSNNTRRYFCGRLKNLLIEGRFKQSNKYWNFKIFLRSSLDTHGF